METLEQYLDSVRKERRNKTFLCISFLALCMCLSAFCIYKSYLFAQSGRDLVYVLDSDEGLSARKADPDKVLRSEILGHVQRFHELLFNISPDSDLIRHNLEKALALCDRSAYEYYSDLSENGFYQRIISADISQQIVIDSTSIDQSEYPTKIHTYAKLYLLRQDSITSYQFESECQSIKSTRTPDNPHGLTLEKFHVLKSTKLETRQRD